MLFKWGVPQFGVKINQFLSLDLFFAFSEYFSGGTKFIIMTPFKEK